MNNVKVIKILMSILAFCLCVSACSPLQIGSSNYDASTQPTPIPGETITDIPRIVEILNQLAEKNVGMYQKDGWWRRINTVIEQSGDLNSADHEEWSHLPRNSSECMAKMDIVKDPSTGNINLWQIQTPEGYMGDLISLRTGESEIVRVDPALCRLTVDSTQAGYLAKALAGDSSGKDSKREPQFAQAWWYEDQNGKQVIFVEVNFKTSFEKLSAEDDVYYFDMETGMAIDHIYSMFWEDGTEKGQFEVQSLYELWEELPQDVAAQYDQAVKEMKSFQTNQPDSPSAPSTPEP
jgi:hypothetical protein